MKPRTWMLLVAGAFGLLALAVAAAEPKGPPAVGDAAPDFRLNDQDGRALRFSEHARGAWAVLAFFPKAATPG